MKVAAKLVSDKVMVAAAPLKYAFPCLPNKLREDYA